MLIVAAAVPNNTHCYKVVTLKTAFPIQSRHAVEYVICQVMEK